MLFRSIPVKGDRGYLPHPGSQDGSMVRVRIPDAQDIGVIHMPLQSVPPGKGHHAASDHQLSPEQIRSSRDVLLLSHPLLDSQPVQLGLVHINPTARPLVGVHPAIVNSNVALEFGMALIPLDVVTSDDGTFEVIMLDFTGVVVGSVGM